VQLHVARIIAIVGVAYFISACYHRLFAVGKLN
jgi:hypothetical protein